MTDSLRLRQTNQVTWDIDGIPATNTPEAAAQMLPAISDALSTGGSLPDTGEAGTDSSASDVGTITADSPAATIPWINIPAIVVQTPDFSSAVSDLLASNPNPYLGTPLQPSAPVLAPMPSALLISWDGLNADGTIDKTPDWDHLEVHISEVATFVPSTTTLVTTIHALRAGQVGQAVYPSTRYGVNQYVRFVAVGRSQAASTPSAVSVGQPGQVHNADIGSDISLAISARDSRHHIF